MLEEGTHCCECSYPDPQPFFFANPISYFSFLFPSVATPCLTQPHHHRSYAFHQHNRNRKLHPNSIYYNFNSRDAAFVSYLLFIVNCPSGKLLQIKYALTVFGSGKTSLGVKGKFSTLGMRNLWFFLPETLCEYNRSLDYTYLSLAARKLCQTIPLTHSLFSSYGGVQRLAHVNILYKRRDCVNGMAQRLGKCNGYVETDEMMGIEKHNGWKENDEKMGLVFPASEVYAKESIEAIKAGKIIAVPTDTLYGFACDACSAEAVNRIYEIKGRKHTSPLAICVGDVVDISRFAATDHLPKGLLDSLLPGPVTVVLRRGESSILEKSLNPGLDSIGVRVPDSNFIRSVARGSDSALALTSANLSGQPSSVDIRDFENLWEQCAYIYDGGILPSGRAGSTVIDLSMIGTYKILRPGSAKEETVSILERYSLVEDGS